MSETKRSNRVSIAAALVGAAIGAGVAMLFAPCSGKELRGYMTRRRRRLELTPRRVPWRRKTVA